MGSDLSPASKMYSPSEHVAGRYMMRLGWCVVKSNSPMPSLSASHLLAPSYSRGSRSRASGTTSLALGLSARCEKVVCAMARQPILLTDSTSEAGESHSSR